MTAVFWWLCAAVSETMLPSQSRAVFSVQSAEPALIGSEMRTRAHLVTQLSSASITECLVLEALNSSIFSRYSVPFLPLRSV